MQEPIPAGRLPRSARASERRNRWNRFDPRSSERSASSQTTRSTSEKCSGALTLSATYREDLPVRQSLIPDASRLGAGLAHFEDDTSFSRVICLAPTKMSADEVLGLFIKGLSFLRTPIA
jgi:hypothetical protein